MVASRRNEQTHWDHGRFVETVLAEKFLSQVLRPVGQQRDPEEILLPGEVDRVLEEFCAVSVSLVLFMDHQVLQENDKAAFRRADGEEQIDHANDRALPPQDENTATARLFENQA